MKRLKSIICVLLSIVIVATLFAGCGDDKDNINFIYPFSANVKSYDPQVAGTSDEFLIIENTFEGLIRINDDGTVVKGCADSWDISADGLTYTFKLKQGLKWDINVDKNDKGEFKDNRLNMLGKEFNPDITAHDFVFALQRAVMKETDCPLFPSISAIKNATKIHSGKQSASTLGVTAKDDYTLVITLERRDDSFMQTLSTAVAMPCNEEFFNATKGRYGLSTKYTLFNGQFYLDQILESSYLLKRNQYYTGEFPAIARELTFKIPGEGETDSDKLKKLESGYYDAAFIRGDESESLKKKDDIVYQPYNDTTWAFVLNTNNELMQSKAMRKAFCLGFTHLDKTDKEHLSPATTLTPSSCLFGANNATKAIGTTALAQNIDESVDSWKKAITVLDMPSIEITIITADYMENYTKKMLQGVQGGLGTSLKTNDGETIALSIKVEAMPLDELKSRVKQGDYSIALYPFSTNSSSATSFLSNVANDNVTGFDTTNMLSAIEDASKSDNLNEIAKNAKMAERSAIMSYSICPMLYETSYYVAAQGVKNIQFHAGTGRVSFVNATR